MADSFNAVAMFGRLRFREWDGILNLPQPKASFKMSNTIWRFARATAFAAHGERAAAIREQAAFEALRKKTPADASWGQNKAADMLAVASAVLEAKLAATPAEALPQWRRAVALQDALGYDEPPAWYYPLRESLGAALLLAGNAAEAETVFREGVKQSRRNGRMLFGLMESLRAQEKREDAEWVRREFEAAWEKADIKLSVQEM
jgi:hypothetical protein